MIELRSALSYAMYSIVGTNWLFWCSFGAVFSPLIVHP